MTAEPNIAPGPPEGTMPDITVYALALSPFSAKVRCFLNLKRLDYRVCYVNPMRQDSELAFTGGHIREMIDSVPDTDYRLMQQRMCREFIARLEGGPFLAGQHQPSLPDCAAYAHFTLPYLHGLDGYGEFLAYEEIRRWIDRMTPLVYKPRPLTEKRVLARHPDTDIRMHP